MLTNDNTKLKPVTAFDTPAVTFDFPGMTIGTAEYAEGPTGCTVFHFPKAAQCACDIRGGECGTIQTQHLDHGDSSVDAIVFTGGSEYGFGAVAGVSAELLKSRKYSVMPWDLVQVPGAVIYDFPLRQNTIFPDAALGRAALENAQPGVFHPGARGVGCSAAVGIGFDFQQREQSGQGMACRQIGETRIAVYVVANAIGAIINRAGEVVRGHRDAATGERRHALQDLELRLGAAGKGDQRAHTTLSLVVTNQRLSAKQLRQLGKQVHTSMARAIQPFHTIYDGDVCFSVTTNEVDNENLSEIALGVIGAELAWDAILNCVGA